MSSAGLVSTGLVSTGLVSTGLVLDGLESVASIPLFLRRGRRRFRFLVSLPAGSRSSSNLVPFCLILSV